MEKKEMVAKAYKMMKSSSALPAGYKFVLEENDYTCFYEFSGALKHWDCVDMRPAKSWSNKEVRRRLHAHTKGFITRVFDKINPQNFDEFIKEIKGDSTRPARCGKKECYNCGTLRR